MTPSPFSLKQQALRSDSHGQTGDPWRQSGESWKQFGEPWKQSGAPWKQTGDTWRRKSDVSNHWVPGQLYSEAVSVTHFMPSRPDVRHVDVFMAVQR